MAAPEEVGWCSQLVWALGHLHQSVFLGPLTTCLWGKLNPAINTRGPDRRQCAPSREMLNHSDEHRHEGHAEDASDSISQEEICLEVVGRGTSAQWTILCPSTFGNRCPPAMQDRMGQDNTGHPFPSPGLIPASSSCKQEQISLRTTWSPQKQF